MKKEFPGYFSGAVGDIEKIWDECLFVLDANVLLNLYRYSDFTCTKLLEVFASLADRLWVPHQVVQEYLTNRLTVIGEVGRIYDDAIKKVDYLRKGLESQNQHPFVTAQTLTDSFMMFDRIVAELTKNKHVHERRINVDEIKDRLANLLEGKVGNGFSRAQLETIIVDGRERYSQKTPPGYTDIKKGGDSVIFSDICRPYGDYIVWLQIIEKAQSVNKPVVFVTGDNKEDWWAFFQGKTLGPQPQLVEEFVTLVGQDFYMYPPDRFLEKANMYLQQDASEQAVNEIRDVREENVQSHTAASFNFQFGRMYDHDLRESHWYTAEREKIHAHGMNLSSTLNTVRHKRNALIEYRAALIGEDLGSEEVAKVGDQILETDVMIASIEQELAALREAMTAVAIKHKALLAESLKK